MPGLPIEVFLDLVVELLEFGVRFPPLGRSLVQLGDKIARYAVIVVVDQWSDLVELDRVIHLPFAEVTMIVHRRDVDVGRDAIDLSAVAIGPVELLNGELQGTRFAGSWHRVRRRT